MGVFASCPQAVSVITDIRRDIPIHLELASMTDKDYMNSIMQEVRVETVMSQTLKIFHREKINVLSVYRSPRSSLYLIKVFFPASC